MKAARELTRQPGVITFGIVMIVLGIAAMIHPRVVLPPKKRDITFATRRYIIETRRVVVVPGSVDAVLIVAGAVLVFFGSRKTAARPSGPRRRA